MPDFFIDRGGLSLASGADVFANITASNRKAILTEASIVGQGATSAAAAYQETIVGACTAPSGGSPTSITANKADQDSAAAAGTYAFGHTTPSATFLAKVRLGFQLYGGGYRYTPRRGQELTHRNGGAISMQQTVGTGTVSVHAEFTEV